MKHISIGPCSLSKLLFVFILAREQNHAVPDMSIHGSLSSVHCSLDLEHYQLIRGLLENNLGEPVEEFLRPYNLQDPSTYVRKQATTHTHSDKQHLTKCLSVFTLSLHLTATLAILQVE